MASLYLKPNLSLPTSRRKAPYHLRSVRREMMSQMERRLQNGTAATVWRMPPRYAQRNGAARWISVLLLHQRIKQLQQLAETPLHYGFYLPNFTDRLWLRPVLERACRAGALERD